MTFAINIFAVVWLCYHAILVARRPSNFSNGAEAIVSSIHVFVMVWAAARLWVSA